jgi:hypothetical protein
MKILSHLDDVLFDVEERPVFAGARGGADGYISVPGKKAIVEAENGRVLGVVGRDYRLVTNREAIAAAKDCCRLVFPDTTLEEWRFDSAEVPGTRATCAVDLVHNSQALDFSVVGAGDKPEAYGPFIRVSNSYNGCRALGFSIGFMRKVCQNGLILPDTIVRYHFSHSRRDIGKVITFNIDAEKLALFQSGFLGMVNDLRARAIPITSFPPLVEAVYGIKYPDKPESDDGWSDLGEYIYSLGDKYAQSLGENAYGVFNAVTDLASRPPELPCFRRSRQSLQRAAGAWLPAFTAACHDPAFDLPKYMRSLETTNTTTGKGLARRN